MEQTFIAQMAARDGRWRLYVVLLNTTAVWPEHDFGRAAGVPTLTQRAQALDALGYTVADEVEWEWIEYSEIPDDPASAVVLLGAVSVRRKEER
ncbi:DUF6303 family protein [Streptomyces sp. NPDC002055]|uniref:DUF6303 family protein n=1 Tax=Streptomyces sp. NPDC002055 TaxID=3154534 RepID=UPI00332BEBD4